VSHDPRDVEVRLIAGLAEAPQGVDIGEPPAHGEHRGTSRQVAEGEEIDHAVQLVGLQNRDDGGASVEEDAPWDQVRVRGAAAPGEDVLDSYALTWAPEGDCDGEGDLSAGQQGGGGARLGNPHDVGRQRRFRRTRLSGRKRYRPAREQELLGDESHDQ
jgi:hypothetical protein